MLDRIQELLRVREISASQFADAIGVSRPVVSHILSGRNKPSLEVVQKIIAAFPDLSLNWLLNGTGPMLDRPAAPAAENAPAAPKPAALPIQPVQSVSQPASVAPVATPAPVVAPVAPVATPQPTAPADLPVEAPKPASQPRPESSTPATSPAPAPAGAEMAYALAEPGKRIRRIVLFYQDGTFSDFQPESGL
ncbi:helix-turn-helix domain-containing protein [Hymenobacter aerophilus]|uniref:helix-turn-helix domain-containing protein n=1 Tax=Hymenobacter aerophilus TaxID=119644 RepID=UPI0003761CAD|nr:helix-turn-helix transcriptional regulator [Hymenobacter aerophilus]